MRKKRERSNSTGEGANDDAIAPPTKLLVVAEGSCVTQQPQHATAAKPSSSSSTSASTNATKTRPTTSTTTTAEITSTLIPPHSYDVHVKKNAFLVKVTLHRVPESLIDVEVVADRVTISTLRHTKKYKLDVEIPRDVEPDVDAATTVMNYSELTVIVPLKKMDTHYSARREEIQTAQKEARLLRFDQTMDGQLKMRSKTVVLNSTTAKKSTVTTHTPSGEKNDDVVDTTEGTTNQQQQKKNKKKNGKHFVTDKSETLRLMQEAANQMQDQIQKKQERFEKLQKARTERIQTRREYMKEREEKRASVYHRILEEKKSSLYKMSERSDDMNRKRKSKKRTRGEEGDDGNDDQDGTTTTTQGEPTPTTSASSVSHAARRKLKPVKRERSSQSASPAKRVSFAPNV